MTRIVIENMNDMPALSQIPDDGKHHMIIIRSSSRVFWAKRQAERLTWYIRNKNTRKLELLPTGVPTELPEVVPDAQPVVDPTDAALTGFLTQICQDFPFLREVIDQDITYKPLPDPVQVNGEECRENKEDERKIRRKQKKAVYYGFGAIPEKRRQRLIKGQMQSKKTWAIMSMSLYYLLKYKISSVIVVENKLDHLDQLMNRVRSMFRKYERFINQRFNNVIHVLDPLRGKLGTDEQFTEAFNAASPRIFIAMRSEKDLAPLNGFLTGLEQDKPKRFSLFIDECDSVDNDSPCLSQGEIDRLKELSPVCWSVSATPITNLMKDEIEAGAVIPLNVPEYYKSILTFNLRRLPRRAEVSKNGEDPFQRDRNLRRYLRDLARTAPYTIDALRQLHPVISLIRIGTDVNPQLRVAEFLYERYGDRVVTITYNGSGYGTTMRGRNLPERSFRLKENGSSSVYSRGVHTFRSDANIGDVLTYLHKNGGVPRFPRIAILAGKMADRGITFGSSNYSECEERNLTPWHLTEMYYIASKSTTQADLLQGVGRLCGVFKDNIPLTLFSNVCDDVIKAYRVQEELIKRAKETALSCAEQRMGKLLPEVPISAYKTSRRKMAKVNCPINKVVNDQEFGGEDWEVGVIPEAHFGDGIREGDPEPVEERKEPEEIENRLRKINNILSGSRNTKLSVLLASIQPFQEYTKEQLLFLIENAGYKQPSSMFSCISSPTSDYGPGKIIEQYGNKWIICTALRNAWRL